MVIDQLSMFDAPAQPATPDAPRCGMCARPARWNHVQQKYAQYCAGRSCDNRERICQQCGKSFTVRANGAGNKYCSAECKGKGYHPESASTTLCAWECGRERPRGDIRRAGIWPYICQECIYLVRHLVDQLKKHKVPHERVRQLVRDPGCEVCGTDLIARNRNPGTGRLTSQLVVDHDHDCCPGPYSCGRCVRGLVCIRCNTAAGMLGDNLETARALVAYLDRWMSR